MTQVITNMEIWVESRRRVLTDEGLMTEDIEECLLPVIRAVGKSGLSSADVFHWCGLMLATDRVGFICREELRKLQASFAEGLMG